MGCWNASCAVSGLSISVGDRIVLIPFINYGLINRPTMLPVRGEYNDYGSIREIDYNDAIRRMESDILANSFVLFDAKDKDTGELITDSEYRPRTQVVDVIPTRQGFWFGREYGFRSDSDKPPNNLEEFFAAVERQMCFGKYEDNVVKISDSSGWRELGFILVHEYIYDWIIETYAFKNIPEHFITEDDIYEIPECFFDKSEDMDSHTAFRMSMKLWDISHYYEENYIRRNIPSIDGCPTRTEAVKLLKLIVEYSTFRRMFSRFRKSYAPDISAGSQHENSAEIKKLNSAVSKFIPSLRKERRIRWGD